MNSFLREYRASLKNIDAEEYLDVYFYRPIAFAIIKVFYRLPLTPNHYSLLALLAGLWGAYGYSQGTEQGFRQGAIYFALFSILDCCDGMVARLKGNGSELGRIIDGLVDYTTNVAIYLGIGIGLSRMEFTMWGLGAWTLTILAGLTKIAHCLVYDHYLNHYLVHYAGETQYLERERKKFTEKMRKLRENKERSERKGLNPQTTFFSRSFIQVYLFYLKLQSLNSFFTVSCRPKLYIKENLKTLKMWGLIGPTVHVTVLIASSLLMQPGHLFYFALVLGNLWMVFMYAFQFQTNNRMLLKTEYNL